MSAEKKIADVFGLGAKKYTLQKVFVYLCYTDLSWDAFGLIFCMKIPGIRILGLHSRPLQ